MEKIVQEHWVIQVNDDLNQIKDSSKAEMEQHWKRRSIYRLPSSVKVLNKNAYKPQVVSFGPYHHGQPQLKLMEANKHRALLFFLKRSNKPLESYIKSLAPLVQDLKRSYDFLGTTWEQDTNAFLKLMILDGCFMLEILRLNPSTEGFLHHHTWNGNSFNNVKDDYDGIADDYVPNDPIFSNHGKLHIMPYVKRDMLMLENQLTMLLLHNLLAIQNDRVMHEEFLNFHILKFYSPNTNVPNIGECLHVLDVYRKSLIFENYRGECPPLPYSYAIVDKVEVDILWSAMELHEAGVRFKKSKTTSLKDISFNCLGFLRLPLIVVDDTTESLFLNLIAFERLHVGAGTEVTSYVFFMANIIDNAQDISLLHLKGIIQNAIGSDKTATKLINSLAKDTTLEPKSSLDDVRRSLHHYCKKPWKTWRANLVHTYFRSPWAILSVIAASFLFALTITQTIYTVLLYYQPAPSSPSPSPVS